MWKVSPNAARLPNSLTNGTAKSAQRVSVHGVAPSPWTITGLAASMRRPSESPSLKTVGSMVRTVWLGRTIVQVRLRAAFSADSQAILS